jgi:hypothetical protein
MVAGEGTVCCKGHSYKAIMSVLFRLRSRTRPICLSRLQISSSYCLFFAHKNSVTESSHVCRRFVAGLKLCDVFARVILPA